MRSGIFTSEFYVTVVTIILGFIVAKGWLRLTPDEVTSAAGQVGATIASGVAAVAYIASRSALKKAVGPGNPTDKPPTA